MSHQLVKITSDEDGYTVAKADQVWCLVSDASGSNANFCEGQVFGFGEGNVKFETKTVEKGGITCKNCLQAIKVIKEIKL